MREIEIEQAAASLLEIVGDLEPDDEIVLTRQGEHIARLRAEPRRQRIKLGIAEGQFTLPDNFDAPLPDDLLALFYDGPIYPDQSATGDDISVSKTEE